MTNINSTTPQGSRFGGIGIKLILKKNVTMSIATYTVFDKNDNRIGSIKAASKKEALQLAKKKYSDATDVARVTKWQIKRSKINA